MQFGHYTIYMHRKKIQDYRSEWRHNWQDVRQMQSFDIVSWFSWTKPIIPFYVEKYDMVKKSSNKSEQKIHPFHEINSSEYKDCKMFNVIKF